MQHTDVSQEVSREKCYNISTLLPHFPSFSYKRGAYIQITVISSHVLIKDDMFSGEAEVQQDQEDLKNTHTSPLKWLPLCPSQGNIIPDKTL